MIQLPPSAQVFVFHESVSFRNQIDGLAALVARIGGQDPLGGSFFIFRAKSHRAVRILFYDGSGYWLSTKRLSKGTFKWWPRGDGACSPLLIRELQILLWGGDHKSCYFPELWKKVA